MAETESAAQRFERWSKEAPSGEGDIPAATVILLRDSDRGLETLMLRRNSKLKFVGGMWVFPGGRVDPEDRAGLADDDVLGAARVAAVREAEEESALIVDPSGLIPFSHWTPPAISPRQFLTWFFVTRAPEGSVAIDDGEIHDHAWMRPGEALARRDAQEIELAPPTWVTLYELSQCADVEAALTLARGRTPEHYTTKIAEVEGGALGLWHGDAGYEDGDADKPGPRHRLWMVKDGYRFERT